MGRRQPWSSVRCQWKRFSLKRAARSMKRLTVAARKKCRAQSSMTPRHPKRGRSAMRTAGTRRRCAPLTSCSSVDAPHGMRPWPLRRPAPRRHWADRQAVAVGRQVGGPDDPYVGVRPGAGDRRAAVSGGVQLARKVGSHLGERVVRDAHAQLVAELAQLLNKLLVSNRAKHGVFHYGPQFRQHLSGSAIKSARTPQRTFCSRSRSPIV